VRDGKQRDATTHAMKIFGFGEHAIRPRGPDFGPKASDAVGKEEGEEEQPEEGFLHPYPYTKPRHGMVDF
jgi:hypothetical protein